MLCRLQHRFLITVMSLESKDNVQIINNQLMAIYANSSFIFDPVCSYLEQYLHMVRRLQITFFFTAMIACLLV